MRLAHTVISALALAALLAFNSAFAATGDVQSLLDAGKNQEAYSLAQTLRVDNEGDSAFDTIYGTAAYRTAHYHEAMFALERVVTAEPENMKARYVLAKTYNDMGNHQAAQHQFKIVQVNNPSADIAEDVSNHLAGLQSKTKQAALLGYVEAYVGHDNNINRATDDRTVSIPFPQPLSPEARRHSDMYRSVGSNLQYYQPIKEDLGLIVKGSISNKDFFGSDEFDETIYDATATLNKKWDKNTFKLGLAGQGAQLSDSNYSRTRGVAGSWNRELTRVYGVSAGLGFNEINYPGNHLLNVDQKFIHAEIHRRYQRIYNSIGFMQTNEEALHGAGNHNARNTAFWFYDLNFYADARNSIQTRLLYSKSERDAQDPVFLENRNDRFWSLTSMWQWRYSEQLSINTRLGISDNNSDIGIYDYGRSYLETGVRYSF